jgi:chromate transporter
VLSGFKPVVVAIVVEAMLKIGGRALKRRVHYLLAASAFVAIYFLHVPFPLIVLAAAGVGLAGARFWPAAFAAAPKTKEADAKTEGKGERPDVLPLVIEDDAPPPPHTLPSRARALKVLAAGITLWLLPLMALVAWRGVGSFHVQEYRFFTQAALVTFGGAYAVLAYVTQAAAGSYGWLTQAQAVDGLALAETTPGPLIMVLQFVGFMAGWNNPQGMDQTTSAVVGALVTTYATFLPCFVFIFLGAPYIEVLRGNKNLTGALNGITAAVVGVVLNLALVFGAAVIWPRGLEGGTDFFALVMSAAAFVALYRLKADVLWVVLVGGMIGLGRALLSAS